MNSNDNNQNGVNSAEDLEHIREIEAILERRSPEQKGNTPASAKKYLRKSKEHSEEASDSTIVINRVTVSNASKNSEHNLKPLSNASDKTPHEHYQSVKSKSPVQNHSGKTPQSSQNAEKTANDSPKNKVNQQITPDRETVKTEPPTSRDSEKVLPKKNKQSLNVDDSRTISMPAIKKEGSTETDNPPKNDNKQPSNGESAEYIPLLTEDDDFEFEVEPDNTAKRANTSAFKGLANVFIYLAFVFTAALIIAFFVINVANDVFAFVKPEEEVTVVIPENCTTEELSKILGDNKAINFPWVFELYTKFKNNEGDYIAGTYKVSPALNYDKMISEFKPKPPTRTTVTVTIPEGYTTDQIVTLLVSRGLGTYEGYERAINNYEYDFEFLKNTSEFSQDRLWKLDGYLYPDTYYYYSTSTEETIIYKMLDNFNNKFSEEYYTRAAELGMSVDEVITLASMIQKEVKYADEYGYVSSVFHNRLKSPGYFPKLESDASIVYAMQHERFLKVKAIAEEAQGLGAEELICFALLNLSEVKSGLSDIEATKSKLSSLAFKLGISASSKASTLDKNIKVDTKYESPYNTYTNNGLPPGPISNPSIDAIRYALYPNTSGYYYFVSGPDGRTTFSKTYAEHKQAIADLY